MITTRNALREDAPARSSVDIRSYHESREQAMRNASKISNIAGAQMVKPKVVAGGDTVSFLSSNVACRCAWRIGFTPHRYIQLGGYRVQGRTEDGAARLKADAACARTGRRRPHR